jgi:hypothetical protein
MAGQGANSMAIARVACNGSISAAQVHWAAFDLEVRAARESMPASDRLDATRTASKTDRRGPR